MLYKEAEVERAFKGRAILAGKLSGKALVCRRGFNSLASFYKSMLMGAKKAVCSDKDNPDLFNKIITGKIICLPITTGSTSAGATWDKVARMRIGPRAMLFSHTVDSLAAAGLIIADIWAGQRIVTIDRLGDEFLDYVAEGDRIHVREDGMVIVMKK